MHIANLKHACGHWQEWLLPCGWRTDRVYAAPLAAVPCPRCAAKTTARDVAERVLAEYHRTMCSRMAPTRETVSRPFTQLAR